MAGWCNEGHAAGCCSRDVDACCHLPFSQVDPRRQGMRNADTLHPTDPTPSRVPRFPGNNKSKQVGYTIAAIAISASCWNQGRPSQWGAITVAAAPLFLSLRTRSSSSSHGGLHQFVSARHWMSGRRSESTASVLGSNHFELHLGTSNHYFCHAGCNKISLHTQQHPLHYETKPEVPVPGPLGSRQGPCNGV